MEFVRRVVSALGSREFLFGADDNVSVSTKEGTLSVQEGRRLQENGTAVGHEMILPNGTRLWAFEHGIW